MNRPLSLIAFLLFGIIAAPGWAVQPLEKAVTLRVHHAKAAVTTENGVVAVNGNDNLAGAQSLADKMKYDIRPDEGIRVVVDDQNPLVYTYTWKGVTKTKTADYDQAVQFAGSLKTLAGLLKVFAPADREQAAPEKPATESPADRYLRDTEKIDEKFFNNFADTLGTLSDEVERIPALTSKSAGSKADAQSVKETVAGWDLDAHTKLLESALDKMGRAELNLVRLIVPKDINDPRLGVASQSTTAPNQSISNTDTAASQGSGSGDGGTTTTSGGTTTTSTTQTTATPEDRLFKALLLAKDQEPRVRQLISGARSFAATAAKINDELLLGAIDFSRTEDSTGTFEIAAAENASGADVKKRKTGTFAFVVSPHTPAHINVGPALVYSFLEAPEFGTEKQEDGQFKIVRKDSGNAANGMTVAAMLSIAPVRWQNLPVSGSFQLGVSPVKDKIGLLGGVTLHLLDVASFGAGLIYQQTSRLARNLSEGQLIGSEDALKTTTRFKPGAYVSMTINLK